MEPGALGSRNAMADNSSHFSAPPLGISRVSVPVSYMTSVGVATSQSCAHLYIVAENESRLPRGKKPQKRLLVIADRATYQSDMDIAISRCVMFSQVKTLMLLEDHLTPLTGPFCEYDLLVQQSTTFDFVRTIGAIFKPHAVQLPTYSVEDGRMLTETVECRLSPNAFQDTVGTVAQEAAIRQLRAQKDRELVTLQEALQKQKDENLLEMVELHTQNETLKHSLSQAEQALLASRRAFKEERDLLVAKLRQYEAEREIRGGRGPLLGAPDPSFGAPSPGAASYAVPNPVYGGGGGQPQSPISGGNWASGNTTLGSISNPYGNAERLEAGGSHHFAAAAANPYAAQAYPSPAAGIRPAAINNSSYAEAPFASSRLSGATWAAPSPGSGLAPPLAQSPTPLPATAGAYGGSARSPRAAFEHLEKTLSDGERFLANTQRRVY